MKAFVALAALALAGCATTPPVARMAAVPAGSHYVALGSSMAAGPGIGPIRADTPARCTRATNNYPSLLAQRLSLDLTDASCSGATTTQVFEAWREIPAQIDAVTPDTRLATITIGGNDLNYMGLLFSASCDPAQGDCAARVHLPGDDAFTGVRDRLAAIVPAIRARAPQARVVFVQYLTLVPPAPCAMTPIDDVAVAEARELATRLADITRQAAEATGAEVLAADMLSRDHTTCDAEPWSLGFPAPSGSAAWHANAAGHRAIADALAAMLGGS